MASGLESLYQEIILDHYRNRRHRGTLEHPTAAVDHNNPVCGDAIHLEILVDDGTLVSVAHTGDGCSISQASASMMGEAVTGKPVGEAAKLIEHMRAVMKGDEAPDEDRLGDAIALEGVAQFPARVKCALLSWMALKDALATNGGSQNGN